VVAVSKTITLDIIRDKGARVLFCGTRLRPAAPLIQINTECELMLSGNELPHRPQACGPLPHEALLQ
jgi:hypothetical protein